MKSFFCSGKFPSLVVFMIMLVDCMIVFPNAYGQENDLQREQKALIHSEAKRYTALMQRGQFDVQAEDRIDVKYYLLDISITTSPQYLRGRVVINSVSLQDNLTSISLDLMNALTIDSIKVGGTSVAFTQYTSSFTVSLDRPYNSGELISVEIFYQGVPGSSGFGSFEFSSHASEPWVWSLSEPYGAKDWWPCKDHPSDKADSVDIIVTCDSSLKVGSNGKLVSVENNGDGTATFHWHESHPITTYLVSVAITNYASFTNFFQYSPTDSMQVLNYVLPEHLTSAMANLPFAVDGLRIYSDLFGLYPFIDEKYGHSEFGWGGGMEHQTMTSLGGFGESLVMHELAHQWFGDMITCRTWPDIWLNEGFATYCEVLYEEKKYGESSYWAEIGSYMNDAKSATESVYVLDTSNVATLFDWNRVYAKGAVVLHMLRHVLGDSIYFQSMYNYAHTSTLRFNTASTADFEAVCESTSGKNLDYFFSEWIYGINYPQYVYAWSSQPVLTGNTVSVTLTQTTGTTNPLFFTMPIDCKISGTGWDTTVTLFNDSIKQTFTLNVSHIPLSVDLDPQSWILKNISSMSFVSTPDSLDFGKVVVGLTKTDSILVTNASNTALNISSITSDEPDFSITPASGIVIPSNGSQKFYVTFAAAFVGIKTAHLMFLHNAPNSPSQIVLTGTGSDTAVVVRVAPFWNIISLPNKSNDQKVSDLFPFAVSKAFSYNQGSSYVQVDSLNPGFGYWLKFSNSSTFVLNGVPILNDTISLRLGWNLIGSLSFPIAVRNIGSIPSNVITSKFFGYDGKYIIIDTIFPGKGYWVKVNQQGDLILAATGNAQAENLIRIIDNGEQPPEAPSDVEEVMPTKFSLEQNYPNPFNPATRIQYSLIQESNVVLKIFNVFGQEIATIVDGVQSSGYKSILWNASNVASGVYFYRLEATSVSDPTKTLREIKKMVLLK